MRGRYFSAPSHRTRLSPPAFSPERRSSLRVMWSKLLPKPFGVASLLVPWIELGIEGLKYAPSISIPKQDQNNHVFTCFTTQICYHYFVGGWPDRPRISLRFLSSFDL